MTSLQCWCDVRQSFSEWLGLQMKNFWTWRPSGDSTPRNLYSQFLRRLWTLCLQILRLISKKQYFGETITGAQTPSSCIRGRKVRKPIVCRHNFMSVSRKLWPTSDKSKKWLQNEKQRFAEVHSKPLIRVMSSVYIVRMERKISWSTILPCLFSAKPNFVVIRWF